MEDMIDICNSYAAVSNELDDMTNAFIQKLREKLWGPTAEATSNTTASAHVALPLISPQQSTKRPKRLTALRETDENETTPKDHNGGRTNADLLAAADDLIEEPAPEQAFLIGVNSMPTGKENKKENGSVSASKSLASLMPPPPPPSVTSAETSSYNTLSDISNSSVGRPQRAAKLRSERNLKEPKLNRKLRRPENSDASIKLEHEQRQSQIHKPSINDARDEVKASGSGPERDQSVLVIEEKAAIIDLSSEDENDALKGAQPKANRESSESNSSSGSQSKQLCVRVKREKNSTSTITSSLPGDARTVAASPTVPMPIQANKAEILRAASSKQSTTLSTATASTEANTAATSKPTRKKKAAEHKPIKVEKFSEIESSSPISTRTRNSNKNQDRQKEISVASVYEDAVDNVPNDEGETPKCSSQDNDAKVSNSSVAVNKLDLSVGGNGANGTLVLPPTSAPGDATCQVDACQATFLVENPNATVTLSKNSQGDTTFNVPPVANGVGAQNDGPSPRDSTASSMLSMATARNSSDAKNDTLITEDESFEKPALPAPPKPLKTKPLPPSAKAYRMPARTNELFKFCGIPSMGNVDNSPLAGTNTLKALKSPLIQSPVKLRVKAFENVAAQASHADELSKSGRPKRLKDPQSSSSTTPMAGKLHTPGQMVLGRFLTPTQASHIMPTASVTQAKKAPNSASKAVPFPKSMTASQLKSASSTSSISSGGKPMSRENSADDVRKGLQQAAEERKKQREQKHLLAAQQREAKERERAERMAKLAKEREEKRLKKLQEAEMKKRELEEINRIMRQQEEAADAAKLKAKAKAIADQERELLKQMKHDQQQGSALAKSAMLPPPPKMRTKFTFEMLHEDDSTDEEGKITYKRPPPPSWSRSDVRRRAIKLQQYWPTAVIDSFFSVQPMTPDLKSIFPNIDERHLKRNSSVFWSTPPRYSELPKY